MSVLPVFVFGLASFVLGSIAAGIYVIYKIIELP